MLFYKLLKNLCKFCFIQKISFYEAEITKSIGNLPNLCSINAKCSLFSCVSNKGDPEYNSYNTQPTLHMSKGKSQGIPLF